MLTKLARDPAPTQGQAKQGQAKIIDLWLHERKTLLIHYCQLAGLPPFHREKQALPTLEQITAFNARLVDYLSAGHFEIYDRIISQAEQHGASKLNLPPSLYPRLTANTQQLLHFHDCYTDISEDDDALLELDQNLSTLGELLEQRFALEDQLIKAVVLTTGQSF